MIRRLWKPWYVHRPLQMLRRLRYSLFPPKPGYRSEQTLWGFDLLVDPTKSIGRGIATTGVHDVAVCEAIVRLVRPGDTVLDVGANVGCMTALAALMAGEGGAVHAFEPHPQLVPILKQNAQNLERRSRRAAQIQLHALALGPRTVQMDLVMPSDFAENDGISRITTTIHEGSISIQVPVRPLDELLPEGAVALMKLDVEGFELEVLRGATRMLDARRITHILFEDHQGAAHSEVAQVLKSHGYRLFALPWSVSGIRLADVDDDADPSREWNYLATLLPDEARRRFATRGWQLFTVRA